MMIWGLYFAAGAAFGISRQSMIAAALPASIGALVLAGPLGYSGFVLGWAICLLVAQRTLKAR